MRLQALSSPHREGGGAGGSGRGENRQLELRDAAELVKITATDDFGFFYDLEVPQEWAGMFQEGSVFRVHETMRTEIYKAKLAEDPSVEVAFKILSPIDARASADVGIRQRLADMQGLGIVGSWGVLRTFETHTFKDRLFVLMEKATGSFFDLLHAGRGRSLAARAEAAGAMAEAEAEGEEKFEEREEEEGRGQQPGGQLSASSSSEAAAREEERDRAGKSAALLRGDVVPMRLGENRSLTILVDLLSGIENLEKAGVLHGDLQSMSVLIKEGRALIGDFASACLVHSGDESLSCDAIFGPIPGDGEEGAREYKDELIVGSAYRHAPEMFDGRPTGPSNAVWAVGLLAAELFLGYCPTEHLLGVKGSQADLSRRLREEIRKGVRKDFSIEKAPGFEALPKDSQDLLSGMLERRQENRWSATGARGQALAVAAARGLHIEAPALRFPSGGAGGGAIAGLGGGLFKP